MTMPAQASLPDQDNCGDLSWRQGDKHPSFSNLPGLPDATRFSACIRPFIDAIGWVGEDRHFIEAHPHFDEIDGLDTLRAMMVRLGIKTHINTVSVLDIGADDLPCIVMLEPDHPIVVLEPISNGVFLAFDSKSNACCEYKFDNTRFTCCFANIVHPGDRTDGPAQFSWFAQALRRFRRPIAAIFGLSLLTNILALATPIYMMNVYNLVIGSSMLQSLWLFLGILVATAAFEFILRRRRGQIIAYIGARFSAALLSSSFERILGLPVAMIESASVGSQVSRLKQFEGIHKFFTGQIAVAILDLPFVTLFFIAIAVISPRLILVPLCLIVIYAVLAFVMVPITRRNTKELNQLKARNQSFLIDTVSNLTTIKQLRGEAWWTRRFAALSRELELKRFHVQFLDNVVTQLAQSLMMIAGVATLFIGANLVMSEALSIGGLIAVMMFIWRVLAPAQTIFVSINRLSQFSNSVKQVNSLMRISPERSEGRRRAVLRKFEGRITFDRVAFRYDSTQEPVLRGVSFDIQPGELIGIASPSSGGKSTILKIVLGLYQPQAGTVLLDRLNLQQLDVHEVRASIGYSHLDPVFFYGTVAQNMQLANPTATDQQILHALDQAGVEIKSRLFPNGLQTTLTNRHLATMPDSLRQQLSLARVYCKQASINLFNDPGALLDDQGDRALLRKLNELKGNTTVMLVTNRRHHLEICDKVFVLKDGVVSSVVAPKIKDTIIHQRKQSA